jgi:NitT/TauT family transport system substrate-binding protein
MVDTGVWGVSYLMGLVTTEGIDSFAGLKGKRIALPFPGAPLDFQTRYLLSRAGVDPDRDLEILYAPFGQSVSLLLSGRIDAAPLPEPLATDLAVGRGLSRLLDYQEAWAEVTGDPRSPQVSLFVTRDTARQHPELLARLVEAWRDSSAVVVESPDSTASRYAGLLGMSPEIVARSVGYTLLYVPGFQENRRRVLSYYELLRSFLPGERPPLGAGFFFLP